MPCISEKIQYLHLNMDGLYSNCTINEVVEVVALSYQKGASEIKKKELVGLIHKGS